MAELPLHDRVGNALVGFRFADESEPDNLDERMAMPLSLIVVTFADAVLMMLDSQRGQ